MRECQLCGVKSWGPLTARGRALLLNAVRPETTEVDFTAYRECDNCAMPALTDIIEKPVPDAQFSDPVGDTITTGLSSIRGMFAASIPQPETRLERIVRAIVAQGRFCSDDGLAQNECVALVRYARAIEQEMDKASD